MFYTAHAEEESLRVPQHVDSQDVVPSNVIVESDGPESDKPETTASMSEGLHWVFNSR